MSQWLPNGRVVTSHTRDFGLCQVNEASGHAKAEEMGLDYKNNIEDNIALCRYIYEQAGKVWTPWVYYNNHIAYR